MKKLSLFKVLALFCAVSNAYAAATPYQVQFFAPGVRLKMSTAIDVRDSSTSALLSEITFATTHANQTSSRIVTITNKTASSITFGATPFTVPAPFSVASTTCSGALAPAASCTLSLTFTPLDDQPYFNRITMSSSLGAITIPATSGTGFAYTIVDGTNSGNATLLKKSDGTWIGAGDNTEYDLTIANPSGAIHPVFEALPGLAGALQVLTSKATVIVQKADGSWWGLGGGGALGLGDTVLRTTLTPLPGLAGATKVIATGDYTFAKLNGVWNASGNNVLGSLGTGDTVSRTTFAPVAFLSDIKQIASNGGVTYVQKPDLSWWFFGNNADGASGDGVACSTCYVATPRNITTIAGALQVIVGSRGSVYAQKADLSWWVTGRNTFGQLGIGPGYLGVFYHHPYLDGATTILPSETSAFAKLANGAWAAAGDNTYGQLGFGNYNTGYFTAVPNLSPTAKIVTNGARGLNPYAAETTIAIMPDGKVYGTGNNSAGQLFGTGAGTPANVTVFTRIYP